VTLEDAIVAEARAIQSGDSLVQASDEYREGALEGLRMALRLVRKAAA
jgi:hypothetical protein